MAKDISVNDPEVIVVAGAMITPALAAEAAKYVEVDDFEDPRLRLMWTSLVEMINEGVATERIDPVSIAAKCAKSRATRSTVAQFCGELLDKFPRFASVVNAAERVHRRATMRLALSQMRNLAVELKDQLSASDGTVADLESQLAQLSVVISARSDRSTRRSVYRDMERDVTTYFDNLASSEHGTFIPTGIHKLDQRLGGGLRPGQIHAILGATGSGKTALAAQLCDSAIVHGYRAIMFSMEVDPIDIFIRDVERRAGRSRWGLRSAHIATREATADALVAAQSALMGAENGKIVYGEPMSLEGIRQAILTEQLRTGSISLVVVDHAQVALPSEGDRRSMPRYLEVKSIAEGLRAIARQLGVAVVLTAQMNPSPKGERPTMALVRESKDIVNCAEVVVIIWHQKEETGDGEMHLVNSWLLADKVRAGQEGKVEVRYRGEFFRFEGIEEHHQSYNPGPETD